MKTLSHTRPHSADTAAEVPLKPRFFPLRPISARTAAWSALLGAAAVGPAVLVSSLFPLSNHSRAAFASVALLPAAGILKHVLIGPVLEEFVYRGGLLPLARRYLPLWVAVVGTSGLFGLTHFPAGAAAAVIVLRCELRTAATRAAPIGAPLAATE